MRHAACVRNSMYLRHLPFRVAAMSSVLAIALAGSHPSTSAGVSLQQDSLLASHVLVTWYGNPHSPAMLGQAARQARAGAVQREADKYARGRDCVDLVLDMDGFGPPQLKRDSYRMVNRQFALPFSGFKLFYRQDTNLLDPADVVKLDPTRSVVIYQ